MQAKGAIDKAFPGSPSPAVVVIEAKDVTRPRGDAGDRDFEQGARERARVRPFTLRSRRTTRSHGSTPDQGRRPQRRRRRVDAGPARPGRPETLDSSAGVVAHVAGEAAGIEDFNQVMRDRAPIVIGFVLLLSFLLLLVTFRSLVVPVKAILLNLLSVGAAYGILVAVFQHTGRRGSCGSRATARSSRGCRSSSSSCSSASRWTTTCSSSAGCASCGRRASRPSRPSSRASPRRPGS